MIFSEFQRLGPACHLIKQNTKMNYNRIKQKRRFKENSRYKKR